MLYTPLLSPANTSPAEELQQQTGLSDGSEAHSKEVWHSRPVADVLEVGPVCAWYRLAI